MSGGGGKKTERQSEMGAHNHIYLLFYPLKAKCWRACQGAREAAWKNRPANTNLNDETMRDLQQTVYSNVRPMEGEMEFTGFGNRDKEREECRQIVINSELFYLWGIRGINRGFGLDSAPFNLFSAWRPGSCTFFTCACVGACSYVSRCTPEGSVCLCQWACDRICLPASDCVCTGVWLCNPPSSTRLTHWSSSKHYKLIPHNRQKKKKMESVWEW